MTEGGVSLGLRYARGFNSLIDTKKPDNEPKAFNNAFTLQLGYLIPTRKAAQHTADGCSSIRRAAVFFRWRMLSGLIFR